MSEKKQVLSMRILVVFFIVISAVIALFQYNTKSNFIAQLMGVSWGALAGSFLAPFLYSLYWKKTTKLSCWVCFIFGSVLMTANMLVRPHFPTILQSPINCGAFAMLAGLVIVPLISLVSKKPSGDFVDGIFSCYMKKKEVLVTDNIGDEE